MFVKGRGGSFVVDEKYSMAMCTLPSLLSSHAYTFRPYSFLAIFMFSSVYLRCMAKHAGYFMFVNSFIK